MTSSHKRISGQFGSFDLGFSLGGLAIDALPAAIADAREPSLAHPTISAIPIASENDEPVSDECGEASVEGKLSVLARST